MMENRRRTILALVLLSALLITAPSVADENSAQNRRELDLRNKLKLVFLFERDMPELAKQGELIKKLETEIRDAVQSTSEATGFQDLVYELHLEWGELENSRGRTDQAIEHFNVILKAGKQAGGFSTAALATALICRTQAEELRKAGNDEEALARYARAEELYRRGKDQKSADEVGNLSANLEAKEGLKAFDEKNYDKALELLSNWARKRPSRVPGSKAERHINWMKQNTGVLTVRTLTVPAQVSGRSVSGLNIALKAVRNGDEIRSRPFAERFRWQIGDYRLQLLGDGGKGVLAVPFTLTTAGGSVAIPSKLPDGMAFIPAGGGVSRPFFIDKTEVTVGEFKKKFPAHSCRSSSANLPAHGVSFADARSYASQVGKKLPSEKQWLRAAFGDKGGKYPWGNTDSGSINRHCNVGTRGPQAVGTFHSGRNEFDLDDMAGNVWEWLDDEYAIGGGFKKGRLGTDRPPAGWSHAVDYLRHKKPSKRVFDSFGDPATRKKYDKYHVSTAKLGEVGFRCVLEF